MQKQKQSGDNTVYRSSYLPVLALRQAYACSSGTCACSSGNMAAQVLKYNEKQEVHMKIVVVKSPRFLAGVLRFIFGIRKSQAQ
ncbi:MAG: stage V sporulation protein SpoVM [Oscillospiraceae bacterium]|nr:stage V sporulation protein SpoVM [Oscillospiraceae bacterium]